MPPEPVATVPGEWTREFTEVVASQVGLPEPWVMALVALAFVVIGGVLILWLTHSLVFTAMFTFLPLFVLMMTGIVPIWAILPYMMAIGTLLITKSWMSWMLPVAVHSVTDAVASAADTEDAPSVATLASVAPVVMMSALVLGAAAHLTGKEVTPMVNQLIQKKQRGATGVAVVDKPLQTAEPTVSVATYEHRLQEGFTQAGFEEGAAVFTGLKKQHDALKPLLTERNDLNSLVDLKKMKGLTDSLYLQGLTLLTQTLDTVQQLGETNVTAMELENKELEEKLAECGEGSTLKEMIEERLEKNRNSMKKVKTYRDRMDETLMRVGLCKDSIREIRLELPELIGHKPPEELERVLLELKTRMGFAQRVHDEYERQGL